MTTRKAITIINGIVQSVPVADSLDPGTSILFPSTITPTITQTDLTTNSGTGATLTIQAQNETGTTSTGGALVLQTGTGTSTNGTLSFKCGATTIGSMSVSGGYGIISAGTSLTGWQLNASGASQNVFIQAQTGFIVNVTTNYYIADSSAAVALTITPNASGATSIRAVTGVTSFTITQDDRTTNSGTGSTLTIQAQNETGTTSTGGTLSLKSGTGTSSNGFIQFFSGSTSLCYLGLNGTSVQYTLETGRSGFSIATSASSQFIQLAAINSSAQIYFDTATINLRGTAQTNGIAIALDGSGANSLSFGPSTTSGSILYTIRSGTGANNGSSITIQAQQGQLQTGDVQNNDGGSVLIASGPPGTGGTGDHPAAVAGSIVLLAGNSPIGEFTLGAFDIPTSFAITATGSFGISAGTNAAIEGASASSLIVNSILRVTTDTTGVGFNGSAAIAKVSVTEAVLADAFEEVLAGLVNYGLFLDNR